MKKNLICLNLILAPNATLNRFVCKYNPILGVREETRMCACTAGNLASRTTRVRDEVVGALGNFEQRV